MEKWVCGKGAKEVILGLGWFDERKGFVRLKLEKRRACGEPFGEV
jgi:hypothetical protein